MTKPQSKDLFDDTTMSFGEHLEVLRIHLWKAIIGIVVCMILALVFGKHVIAFVRAPIDRALTEYHFPNAKTTDDLKGFDFADWLKSKFGAGAGDEDGKQEDGEQAANAKTKQTDEQTPKLPGNTLAVRIKAVDLYRALEKVSPDSVNGPPPDEGEMITLLATADEFEDLKALKEKQTEPVSLNVQEAFLTYLKVALVAGFVIASPWIFYQIWLFVAAGLYPHEKRYVYIYLPMSIVLFIGGALFCFYMVFPFVLDFLLEFNKRLSVQPQIRLSEWVSFAILLPMMFGISFQLPLAMLFLERLSIFTTETYREKRRMAVLVIAIISMLLTPMDPMSMVMMMAPLVLLYEVGIGLCGMTTASKSPFDEAPA